MEVPQKHVLEGRAPSKVTTQVGADTATIIVAVLDEEPITMSRGETLSWSGTPTQNEKQLAGSTKTIIGKNNPIFAFVPTRVIQC